MRHKGLGAFNCPGWGQLQLEHEPLEATGKTVTFVWAQSQKQHQTCGQQSQLKRQLVPHTHF